MDTALDPSESSTPAYAPAGTRTKALTQWQV